VARNKRRTGSSDPAPKAASKSKPGTPAGSRNEAANTPPVRRWKFTPRAAVAAALASVTAICLSLPFVDQVRFGRTGAQHITSTAPALAFVGSEACAGCHQKEMALWRDSQHRHAMQHASAPSVLGDFDDASFDCHGVHSRFFKKDGNFFVETDGPDGELATFEVKYTFGIEPLQQYLIEFPDGRIQALSIAWDSRPKDRGGQRWFHLYPNEEIKHDDVLHWTKLNQNWNFMCAECHSTGVHKNYDAANDRFHTTWAEISVGCEACHGKGSRHVDWAYRQRSWWPFGKDEAPLKGLAVLMNERDGVTWQPNLASGDPQRSVSPAATRREVETCGLCHARRAQLSENWVPGRPLSDTHLVSPLAHGLYNSDGQMLDEVYNYDSFKQSKMFAAGVTCSDCHEPHSAKLRVSGDGVCLQCHVPDRYETFSHSHHPKTTSKVECVSCHMPVHTYMTIDKRHDHSLRIPRPDISVKLGTPNTCHDCHADKSAQWAADLIERWHGPIRKGFQNYAEAFNASWTNRADAAALLAMVAANPATPAIARASALSELHARVSPANIELARKGVSDPDPLVRIGALDMLDGLPGDRIWPIVSPLLSDSSSGVRIRAVSVLASLPTANQPASDRADFERAAGEFVAAQRLSANRPEARLTLGNFLAHRGLSRDAENEYRAALRLNSQYTPAAINLADLLGRLGRDGDGENVLRTIIDSAPPDAGLHHALGLTLTRERRSDDAIAEFRIAAVLEPDRSRYVYVYAVALHSSGRVDDAIKVLNENLAQHSDDRDTLLALVIFNRDAGDIGTALQYAERLSRTVPDDRDIVLLVDDLRARVKQ
jgi:predicted CXXCH cytochrome family protein